MTSYEVLGAEERVEYLLSIRPANPGHAPIHFNPISKAPAETRNAAKSRRMIVRVAVAL